MLHAVAKAFREHDLSDATLATNFGDASPYVAYDLLRNVPGAHEAHGPSQRPREKSSFTYDTVRVAMRQLRRLVALLSSAAAPKARGGT
jgi:hypothetical protein